MKIEQLNTYEEICHVICEEICAAVQKKPSLCLCIAAGHTSLGILEGLRTAAQEKRADFSNAVFVAMDEWLDMNENMPESCGALLRSKLLDHVAFRKVRLFDGCVADLKAECEAIETFVKEETTEGAIDYLVLGCGMNGHLGLNEPGTPLNSRTHISVLDEVTKRVGQKYFKQGALLSGGITMGLANFVEAKRSVLPICGAHKRKILNEILACDVPKTNLPASAMLLAEHATLYCDGAAAGKAI